MPDLVGGMASLITELIFIVSVAGPSIAKV
jgi:hypothetical protein